MRFSAIAVSAAVLGVAMAAPAVVYETDVVTITSCAADITNCPGRAHSSTSTSSPSVAPTPVVSAVSTSPAYTPPVVMPTYTSIPTSSSMPMPSSSCTSYYNATASVPSYTKPTTSLSGTLAAVASTPASTYAWTPSGSAGIPSAPANTSTPVTPTAPPPFKGAASTKGFSIAAVAMAAAAFVLA